MNTHQLNSLTSHLHNFLGVFASNEIPSIKLTEKPKCMIVNLDPSSKPGSHWIAFCVYKKEGKRFLEFFDSYGTKPPLSPVNSWWKMIHNPYRLQSPNSIVCGQYCLYFVKQRLKGRPFKIIIKTLKDKTHPDSFVRSYGKEMISKQHQQEKQTPRENQRCRKAPKCIKHCKTKWFIKCNG